MSNNNDSLISIPTKSFWWVLLRSLRFFRLWIPLQSALQSFEFLRITFIYLLVRSFNQPKFCSNATWNLNAVIFANSTIIGFQPHALFVTTNNTTVVPSYTTGQILIWHNNATGNPTTTISVGFSFPWGIFVISDGQIFVDNSATDGRVDRWTLNGTRLSSTFFPCSRCSGLFVDVNNHLYCSARDRHQVLRQSLSDPSDGLTIVAGTGCSGSTDELLNRPHGIFVTRDLDIYVADTNNNRVQLFRSGQRDGSTLPGNRSTETIALNRPLALVVDADGYLFIVDSGNHRIVGSDRNGFRCLVGCSRVSGAGSSQLNIPHTMSFDVDGNIFVTDHVNNRIQKFVFISDSCGKEKMRERGRTRSPSEINWDSFRHKWEERRL